MRSLATHADARGQLTEVFRGEWDSGVDPVQWSVLHSGANVLRGMHVRLKRDDYYVLTKGQATLGLYDLRRSSATYRQSARIALSSEHLSAIVIPAGVLHGMLYRAPSMILTGRSDYLDKADELGCRWSDPTLGLDWRVQDPILVGRDAERPSLAELEAELARTGFS